MIYTNITSRISFTTNGIYGTQPCVTLTLFLARDPSELEADPRRIDFRTKTIAPATDRNICWEAVATEYTNTCSSCRELRFAQFLPYYYLYRRVETRKELQTDSGGKKKGGGEGKGGGRIQGFRHDHLQAGALSGKI